LIKIFSPHPLLPSLLACLRQQAGKEQKQGKNKSRQGELLFLPIGSCVIIK